MLRKVLPLALGAWALAGLAFAELSKAYLEWPSTAAGFLLTKDEKKAYDKLKTDDEAKAFIDLFWARRDPDPGTAVNELKADFEVRVAAADKMFSFGQTPGSVSDRGRTLLLMGRPASVQPLPPSTGGEEGEELLGSAGAREVWQYTKEILPAGAKEEVLFVFVESALGAKDYHVDRRARQNVSAQKLLASAPERLLLHPKLTEVPKMGLLPNSKAPTPQQLAILTGTARPWPEGAQVLTATGMAAAGAQPLWIFVYLPDSVPPATQSIGRVSKAEGGEEVGTFAAAVMPISVTGGRGYELSVPVDAGARKVDLALLGDSGPLAVTTVAATTEAAPAEGPILTSYYWGVDVRQNAEARLGDPFNIGGWHVIPRVGNHYLSKETISYFCFVLRPTLDERNQPKVEVALSLYAGDKKMTEVPAQATGLSQIGGDLWMFGSSLPLRGFRKAGDYRLDVTLKDVASGVSRTTQMPITIDADAPVPQGAAEPAQPPAAQPH